MKLQKASVELNRRATSSGYRLTLYMGLNSDSGPDYPVLLESVNDLYKYFNTTSDDSSFAMAEFCLNLGYRVYGQRVNIITSKSSSRKFIVPNSSTGSYDEYFYSPSYEDYSEFPSDFIPPVAGELGIGYIDDTLYSGVFNYTQGTEDSLVSNKILIIIPRIIRTVSNGQTVTIYARFIGSSWTEEELEKFSSSVGFDYKLTSSNLTVSQIKEEFRKFLSSSCCNFKVEEITDYTDYVLATTPIQAPQILNAVTDDKIEYINFESSGSGLDDCYCKLYDKYKVCTIKSKYEDGINDIEVSIFRSLDYYQVEVSKLNREKTVILSESFQFDVSTESLNYISNLSNYSQLVDIEIHDETADMSGTYYLKGKTKTTTSTMYSDSLIPDESANMSIDIVVDNSESTDQTTYVPKMKKVFPNSLLLTDYDGIEDRYMNRTCVINPPVIWKDSGRKMKGLSYLLYLLPVYSAGSDSYDVSVDTSVKNFSSNSHIIDNFDYEISLMGVNATLQSGKSKFPVKTVISVLAVVNAILHSTIRSVEHFIELLTNYMIAINKYLGTDTRIYVLTLNVSNGMISSSLEFYVNTQIITSYRVSAKLVV